MAHVFISYKHEDGDSAELIKNRLASEGFGTWMDSDIQGGEKWSPAIDQAIADSFAVVVVMSPEARKSDYVTYEWSFALGMKKTVIPIKLRETDLHPKLGEFQYIDFTNRNARPWERLFDRLKICEAEKQPIKTHMQNQKASEAIPVSVRNAIDVLNHPEYFFTSEKPLLGNLRNAVNTLAASKHPLARSEFLRGIEHSNTAVRKQVIEILGTTRDKTAIQLLNSAVRDTDTSTKIEAIKAISIIADDQGIEGLIDALGDPDYHVQIPAVDALANFPNHVVVGALIDTLQDKIGYVRAHAAKSLGKLRDPQAVSALLECLKDKDKSVRENSARALTSIGTPEALAAIEEWERKQQKPSP